jgi:hypothetical protein
MTEAPKGLLHVLGEMFEEMQTTGCTYEEARRRQEERQQEEELEFSNVISLDAWRARRWTR